jgi:hypothetical protein
MAGAMQAGVNWQKESQPLIDNPVVNKNCCLKISAGNANESQRVL